jgi:hypothetical protein
MPETTLQQAAQSALDCQDACNLSGVLASFKEIVHEVIWPEARRLGKGTDYVNRHPIVTLFLHKLISLNGTDCICTDSVDVYSRAAAEVRQILETSLRRAPGRSFLRHPVL